MSTVGKKRTTRSTVGIRGSTSGRVRKKAKETEEKRPAWFTCKIDTLTNELAKRDTECRQLEREVTILQRHLRQSREDFRKLESKKAENEALPAPSDISLAYPAALESPITGPWPNAGPSFSPVWIPAGAHRGVLKPPGNLSDSSCTGDAIRTLKELNLEIYQLGGNLSRYFDLTYLLGDCERLSPHLIQTNFRMRERFGQEQFDLLVTKSESDPKEMIFKYAVQATCVSYCQNLIDYAAWSPIGATNECLRNLYSEISDCENQQVTGCWRSLTTRYIRLTNDRCASHPNQLLDQIVDLLNATTGVGSTKELTESVDSFMDFMREAVSGAAKGRLEKIHRLAEKLRKEVLEEVVAENLTLTSFKFGHPFNPSEMEDLSDGSSWLIPSTSRSQKVSFTVELGLDRSEKIPGLNQNKAFIQERLVKPKVVLLPWLQQLIRQRSCSVEAD